MLFASINYFSIGFMQDNFKEKLELEKMYCSKFNTDYAIMGETNKYIIK